MSNPIEVRKVKKVTLSSYVPPVEKVDIIGWNATTGNFPVIANNTEYQFIIAYVNDDRALQQRQTREVYNIVTSSSATRAELAFKISLAASYDKGSIDYRKVEVLTNGAYNDFTNAATVTNGSKMITSTAHGVTAAGEYVRIGGITDAFPVYKVSKYISTSAFEIETPYQGASGSVLAINIGTITTPTVFGIKTTGKAIAANSVDLYTKVDFTTVISEVEGSQIPDFTKTTDTGLNYGRGFWQQVKDKEYLASGYLGVNNRTQHPGLYLNPPTHAVVDNKYNLLTIEHDSPNEDGLGQMYSNPQITTIAFYSSSAPTTSAKQTAVIDILESLFESIGIFVE